jgi:hypothetical protein
VKNGVRLGAGRYRFEPRLHQGVPNWLQGWRSLTSGVDRVISRVEISCTGQFLNPRDWIREIMEKLKVDPHSETFTDTWTTDFLSREGEVREVVGKRLRDKTVPCQVQRRLIQVMTNSFPCGTHLNRMGLRRSNEYTLCQRSWREREDDENEGCGRSDPETLVHIQSARCTLQRERLHRHTITADSKIDGK